MARKHKHEEHQNHERWVISYADMVTLLFALFVVLYALGEVKLKKLKELKQSLAFAFHFEGHGKTYEDGEHDKGEVGGDLIDAAMIVNLQKGPMKEFLVEALPEEFEEITGKSLDVVLNDDSVAFTGPLSAFFAPGSRLLRQDVHPWLTKLVEGTHSVASRVRVQIVAPQARLGTVPGSQAPYYTMNLCVERLTYLQQLIGLMGKVAAEDLWHEFHYAASAGGGGGIAGWEDRATITIAFSNPDK